MTRPWVRLVLVCAGLAAMAAAGFVIWSSESRVRAESAAERQAADAGRRALADAAELRSAQQAYVAVGQGEDFWFARVSALSKDLDDVLAVFKRHLVSPEALAAKNGNGLLANNGLVAAIGALILIAAGAGGYLWYKRKVA